MALPTEIWPAEVDLILSAMEAAGAEGADRRAAARMPYRTRAELRLYADRADSPPRVLYTRDFGPRDIGFITPHLLPLGYGGWLTLTAPDGNEIRVECTIYRCRRTVSGWFEGALKFSRELNSLG
ncbi:MAG: hypothetical protein RMJ35_08010 [Phycisphaerales bacterium]|nr:hypothetical protein [Phycisphaerales bacterium]